MNSKTIPGCVPCYARKRTKTEDTKNICVWLVCHKLMTLAMYNGQSLSLESHLSELEEDLVKSFGTF